MDISVFKVNILEGKMSLLRMELVRHGDEPSCVCVQENFQRVDHSINHLTVCLHPVISMYLYLNLYVLYVIKMECIQCLVF